MASEESPLLASSEDIIAEIQHEAVYERFSSLRKKVIVAIVSLAGLIPRMLLLFMLYISHLELFL